MVTIWRSWRPTSAPRSRRQLWQAAACVLLAGAALTLTACSSSDGPTVGVIPPVVSASFTPSSTPASANTTRLRSTAVSGNLLTLEVAISGVTTSSDLYSFVFDLVLGDGTVARYVGGTASFGSALTLGAGQGSVVLASQTGNRVVIGVSKSGGGTGNGIGATEEAILSLTFEVLKAGTTSVTIMGSPTNPQNPTANPAALDSTGAVIPSVVFDGASAQISGA